MEIRISRKAVLRLVAVIGLPIFILVMYWIGTRVTPYGQSGFPILLSPSTRDAMAYRHQAMEWNRRLGEVDSKLTQLQANRQADVYEQTRQAENILSSSLQLAQEIELRRAPSALAGLKGLLVETSQRYYAAAQAAAQWVGAPTPDNQDAVGSALGSARAALRALSGSRWLTEEVAQPIARPGSTPAPTPTKSPDPLDLPAP